MKKLSILLLILLGVTACSEKENNLLVKGQVKGLKKGTIYLQKIDDTLLINVDSIQIDGDSNFELGDYIKSPQIMYLYLEKAANIDYDDRIEFFAEEGEVTINTTLKNFQVDAQVIGSSNQEKLMDYRKMMQRFNDKNLELIQLNFEAQRDANEELIISTNEQFDKLLKRKYLFTVNFAVNNKDLDIAPYLALSEVFDANIKYLDTIYSSLTPEIKKNKYGKELKTFLKERRKNDKLSKKVENQ